MNESTADSKMLFDIKIKTGFSYKNDRWFKIILRAFMSNSRDYCKLINLNIAYALVSKKVLFYNTYI